jgi:hypothetical protein
MSDINPETNRPWTKAELAAKEAAEAAARDQAGAVLVPSDNLAGPVTTSTVAADDEAKNEWAKALIVAGAPDRLPAKADRKVIVVQVTGEAGKGAIYPKTADAYLGYAQDGEEDPVFSEEITAPIYLMGLNVRQFGFRGLSETSGFLSVGPAHPVYAAVNLAYQQGARDVKVVGLTDAERAQLRPWFEEIRSKFDVFEYGA